MELERLIKVLHQFPQGEFKFKFKNYKIEIYNPTKEGKPFYTEMVLPSYKNNKPWVYQRHIFEYDFYQKDQHEKELLLNFFKEKNIEIEKLTEILETELEIISLRKL